MECGPTDLRSHTYAAVMSYGAISLLTSQRLCQRLRLLPVEIMCENSPHRPCAICAFHQTAPHTHTRAHAACACVCTDQLTVGRQVRMCSWICREAAMGQDPEKDKDAPAHTYGRMHGACRQGYSRLRIQVGKRHRNQHNNTHA